MTTSCLLRNNLFIETLSTFTVASEANTLVVFDSRVSALDILYSALLPGTLGYTLNAQEDALVVITQLLANTGVKQLALVAHGVPGMLYIGAKPLNLSQLQAQAHLLQEWNVEEITTL